MKRQITLVGILVAMCGSFVYAQAPQAPKPSAEHKKLAVFLGSWSVEGEYKPGNAYGVPAGKVTQVERFQWLPGEFFLQMNRDGRDPSGDVHHVWIMGYDTAAKKYTGQFFGLGNGGSGSASGTNAGNIWSWSGNGHSPDGKAFQERCTVTLAPNVSYNVKCETSPDGKTWSPSLEWKATKSKS